MSSIKITFPDGNAKAFPMGTTGMEIAKGISQKLGKEALGIVLNGNVANLSDPIVADASVAILTWNDKEGKNMFWHSSAHLLAEALQALYPKIKFTIGPPVDNGFYYDVDTNGESITPEDFDKIEKKMKELAQQKNPFIKKEVSKAEAIAFYTQEDNAYKLELIKDLTDGEITFYTQGNFTDLCRGPHIPDTGYIKAIKLLNLAGAYWRGNENNPMLTRIYGITYPKQAELDEYLAMLEEAKKRDHRKLGKELEIFTFDEEVGPGLPLWLPNGAVMIEMLEELAKKSEKAAGYDRVRSPHLAKESLYLTSGHLPYYEDSMFPAMEIDNTKYYLKAMNCPHHHKIYKSLPRSYKDLPIRFAEYGTCYRYEKSGELFGLMRVRSLQMNDAHIYCTPEQFEQEFIAVNELYLKYFEVFGIDKYVMRFSTHAPEKLGKKYVNEPELWKKTEDMVRGVLISSGIPYVEIPDEAAFYGPKIDVQVWSAIGREFTLATNQVDFAQPTRFGLTYKNNNNEEETPICIHRAPLGTHERFIGFLIEHYAGKFPVWLAPIQVSVLLISEKYENFAKKVVQLLKKHDIRTSFDDRGEKIGKKIRDAELKKIPYMFIIGEKEADNESVSIRKQGIGDVGMVGLDEIVEKLKEEIRVP
jgi:threonyl-tRNA synthetase